MLGNRDTLTAVPLVVVGLSQEELIDVFVNMSTVCGTDHFERFWWDTCESWCLCIFEFTNRLTEFFPGDGVVEFPEGATLWDVLEDVRIDGAVVVEYIGEVGTKYRHVLSKVCCFRSIRELHCHVDAFLVVCSFALGEQANVFPGDTGVE